MGGEGFGAVDGEFGEGSLPVSDRSALNEAGWGVAWGAFGVSNVCCSLAGCACFAAVYREPHGCDSGLIREEMPFSFGDFSQLVVQGLNSVGRVDWQKRVGAKSGEGNDALLHPAPDSNSGRAY